MNSIAQSDVNSIAQSDVNSITQPDVNSIAQPDVNNQMLSGSKTKPVVILSGDER